MKYIIWTHFDTGISQTIEAKNEDEAIEKAEENLESVEFKSQLLSNLQKGKSESIN